ncbi:hypothetical protein DICPUDRAFT_158258 [Dictyostelium purpureum]|uniref:NADH:flavin oxidoreductase/NADH oxidase N-terminal domain-containing protein n=1 Tax=Dictyostelium purpureum TaxID=5786 RepID=F1A169_DICPU|nr:uncharacterized protein DICPUDRAFT_158258 [Dictyostelium purpureum]EGC30065.1 hypothetical protein DICPUDRAFT_158258 [Dictyostelium purpureum]|eukprot:XP_003293411.1 hypothetical protein DICPUDRAFT_158258 [Dictyostelium purpureum]
MQEFEFLYNKPTGYIEPGNILEELNEGPHPKLFTPIKIRELELKNRVVVSPMCTYSSKEGYASDFHLTHYGSFVKSGAGLVVVEASAVTREQRISFSDLGIWSDDHIPNLKRIVDFAHKYDSKIGIQLSAAGRKASTLPPYVDNSEFSHKTVLEDDPSGNGWKVSGISPIAWNSSMVVPKEMTKDDIAELIDSFKKATIRSIEAGFDVICLHFAHGYLLSSALSPTSNKRTDDYGGSFEGRFKLAKDIILAVRSVWNGPLTVRISCDEYIEGGWTSDDSVRFSLEIEKLDVDLIECSSGGNSSAAKIKSFPLYQVPLAHHIKRSVSKLLVGAVGLINNAADAESVLQDNKADLILFGRGFLRNPFFTLELANQLNLKVEYPLQYDMERNLI